MFKRFVLVTETCTNSMRITDFDKEIAEGIKQIIDRDISIHYTTAYLAIKAAIGESRLKILFKKVYNTTLYNYLLKQRMSYARELLQQKNNHGKHIARLTGYKSYSNFIRAFKKHTGFTPALYIKHLSENKNIMHNEGVSPKPQIE